MFWNCSSANTKTNTTEIKINCSNNKRRTPFKQIQKLNASLRSNLLFFISFLLDWHSETQNSPSSKTKFNLMKNKTVNQIFHKLVNMPWTKIIWLPQVIPKQSIHMRYLQNIHEKTNIKPRTKRKMKYSPIYNQNYPTKQPPWLTQN